MWSICRRFCALIRRTQHAINDDPPTGGKATLTGEQQSGREGRILGAISQARDAIASEQEANRKESSGQSRKTRTIAWWTFGALAIYTLVTLLMYCTMRESLDNTREALKITERAYVYLAFSNGKLMKLVTLKENEPIRVAIYLQNSGRLPATRVVVNYGISIPKGQTNETRPNRPYNLTTCDPSVEKLVEHPYWVESIIPGGVTETRYLFAPDLLLTRSDFAQIVNARKEIAVLGAIQYCDGFGRIQCSMFCVSYKSDDRQDFVPCLRGVLDYCPVGFRAADQKK